MKKIIINGRFLLHRVTGVERYAREMVNALDDLTSPGQLEIVIPPEVEDTDIPEWKNITVKRVGKLHNRMWEHVSFPAYVKLKGGISLNLCNVAPLPDPGIVTIHDIKPIVHPEYYSEKVSLWYRLLFKNALRRARMVLTVSKFSAKEIRRYYRIDPHRMSITPEGWQQFERLRFDEYALERYGLEKGEYYFTMGSRDPAKNLKWVIESARMNPDTIYAISGNVNKNLFASMEAISSDQVPENVKFLGYVRDEEAKTLMRDCKAFLFPSFYEGFGLPPLEALSAGCPCVVVSDIPVMHELFEDEAVYIDPHKAQDFTCKNVNAGKILAKYSWRKSAKKLLRILESV